MAARRPISAPPFAHVLIPTVDDPVMQQALDRVSGAVQDLQGRRKDDVVTSTLVDGINKVPHGLGRAVLGYTVTPTSVSAAFAHAIDTTNPRPDLEVWIEVVGGPQTNAIIRVF